MKLLISFLLWVISFSSWCQNLVINSSFEDKFTCNINKPERPYGWYNVTKWAYSGYYPNIAGSSGDRNLELIVEVIIEN